MLLLAIFLESAATNEGLRILLLVMLVLAILLLLSGSIIAIVTLRSYRKAARDWSVAEEAARESDSARL
jgi:flagellar basal body-associated protein FliL